MRFTARLTVTRVDACLSWEQTIPVLERLREGVRGRRILVKNKARGLDANGVKLNGKTDETVKVNGTNGMNGAHP